ncbi:MAG: IPT/TIG domain-containing protein [Ignavibacteria bacterium]
MKVLRFIVIALVLFTLTIILMPGCEYDVAEPQWDITEYNPPDTIPIINSISPQQAVPGTNIITILGENFDLVPLTNIKLEYQVGPQRPTIIPEIIGKTETSITIRRPNLVTDSCYAKVWRDSGSVVKFGPYKIDPVMEEWGSFLENQQLNALAADNAENLYVVQGSVSPYSIVKISAAGERSVLLDSLPVLPPAAGNAPTDAVIGPDGNLYLLRDNRQIQKINSVSGEATVWHRLSANERLSFGDFDANGYFYTGGPRTTDLWIIAPDSSSSAIGVYSTDSIWNVKVYGNQVYVVVGGDAGLAIWRHSIISPGIVDPIKQLVLDFSARFGYRSIESIAVSSDGKIFIGTDAPEDPVLIFDPASDNLDYFYKNILPPYCKAFSWGIGDYFYMISGNTASATTPAQTWDCFRVDAGVNSAQ